MGLIQSKLQYVLWDSESKCPDVFCDGQTLLVNDILVNLPSGSPVDRECGSPVDPISSFHHKDFIQVEHTHVILTSARREQRAYSISVEKCNSTQVVNYNDFPFLCDLNTCRHVVQSKVLFIMRGLPGSGKSSTAQLIIDLYQDSSVMCSADSYFYSESGEYEFAVEKLPHAHQACQHKAERACIQSVPVIVIDNTNVKKWEMNAYLAMARKYSYTVITVVPKTPWRFDATELAQRNSHGVPEELLKVKLKQFVDVHPLYYAWLLDETYSDILYDCADAVFSRSLHKSEALYQLMQSLTGMDDLTDFKYSSWYGRDSSAMHNLHCTGFFSGRGKENGSVKYADSMVVRNAMGQMYPLYIIGFVITPRTFGARVHLMDEQLPLWKKDDFEQGTGSRRVSLRQSNNKFLKRTPHRASDVNSCPNLSYFHPTCGLGSRAHITLGYSTLSKGAVQTGFDLVDLVAREEQHAPMFTNLDSVSIEGGELCRYDDTFAVYLSEPLPLTSLFSGRY